MLGKFAAGLASTPVGRTFMPGPLELFQKENKKKLAHFVGGTPILSTSSSPGLLDGYFQGRNIIHGADGVEFGSKSETIGKRRRGAGYAVGGLLAANALGINPFGITSGLGNLAMLGGHATVGAGLYGMGGGARVAGMAYLGATAVNTFRSGNNAGPM